MHDGQKRQFGRADRHLADLGTPVIEELGDSPNDASQGTSTAAAAGATTAVAAGAAAAVDVSGGQRDRRLVHPPTGESFPPSQTQGEAGGAPAPRRRKRGGGRRGRGLTAIYLVNTSGRPQMLAAVEVVRQKGGSAAILVQEHQSRGAAMVDLHHQVKEMGWKVADTEAVIGAGGGSSAGTCIVAPRSVGWAPPANDGRWDWSPIRSPGRVTAAWLEAGTKCGLLLVSLYLWTSEGMSARNLGLLEQALVTASRHGSPWIIGMDANVSPEALTVAASRLLERFGAVVKNAGEATFSPGRGAPSELDFFLVDCRIADAVEKVEIELAIPSRPHKAVRLDLKGSRVSGLITTMRAPKAFPRALPVGCARAPCDPPREGGQHDAARKLETKWWTAMTCIETELCGRFDYVDSTGAPNPEYTGRALGPKIIQLPCLPPRCTAGLGKVDRRGHALVWFALRAEEMLALLIKARQGAHTVGHNAGCQWSRLRRKFAEPRGLLVDLINHDPTWRDAVGLLAGHSDVLHQTIVTDDDVNLIRDHIRRARAEATARAEQRRAAATVKWREWIRVQTATGASALHRYVKRQKPVAERSTGEGEQRTASPQALVDADLPQWDAIWSRLKGIASAPWIGADISSEAALPRPSIDSFRRVARRFKPWTGVGADLIQPSAFAWLSDSLVEFIIDLFLDVESLGRWPEQLMLVLMHLIYQNLMAGGGRLASSPAPSEFGRSSAPSTSNLGAISMTGPTTGQPGARARRQLSGARRSSTRRYVPEGGRRGRHSWTWQRPSSMCPSRGFGSAASRWATR
jgi:hypothetical protein